MTKANFNFSGDTCKSFKIEGHANYAKYEFDIVCSAITTATFYTINLISKISENYQLIQNEKKGLIELVLSDELSLDQTIKMVIDSFIDVLTNISSQYPKNLKIAKISI